MGALEQELARALRAAKSQPIRSVLEFAEAELRIPGGSKHAGEKLNMDRQPVQRILLSELAKNYWLEVIVAAPSQSAKTFIAFDAPIAYHAAELREDIVVGIPNSDMVNDKWFKEIKPIFEASPSLRRLLPTEGPGSKGGRVRDSVRLTNGAWLRFFTAGGSDQSKAGFTARVVITTEAAGWSEGSETSLEADPLEQMRARSRSWNWDERLLILEGTITIAEHFPWSLKEDRAEPERIVSSDSRIVGPCPWCGDWISPERDDLVGWEDARNELDAARNAAFACPECGELINDEQRIEAVSKSVLVHRGQTVDALGNIVGPMPDTRRLWFRWSAWHNLFNSIGSLAVDEWKAAQHDPGTLARENAEKKQCQFVWAIPYESDNLDAIEVDPAKIVNRRADQLPRGVLPDDTTHLAIGVDVSRSEGHWYALAGRADGTLHTPAYGVFDIRGKEIEAGLAVEEALALFDKDVVAPGFVMPSGAIHSPRLVFVDAGWQTDAVFRAWIEIVNSRSRSGRWLPIFGRGSAFMDLQRYSAPNKKGGGIAEIGDHWHVSKNKKRRGWNAIADVDYWKTRLHESLALPPGNPGSLSLYAGSDKEHKKLATHFANEVQREKRDPKRGIVKYWERVGAQHWLDAAVYAMVAVHRLGWSAENQLS